MKQPSPKQQALLDFITEYQIKNDKSPTFKEMADHLGKSLSTVQSFLYALERKKIIQKVGYFKIININK